MLDAPISTASRIRLSYPMDTSPDKPLRLASVTFVYFACPCGIIRETGSAEILKFPVVPVVTVGVIVTEWNVVVPKYPVTTTW